MSGYCVHSLGVLEQTLKAVLGECSFHSLTLLSGTVYQLHLHHVTFHSRQHIVCSNERRHAVSILMGLIVVFCFYVIDNNHNIIIIIHIMMNFDYIN